MKGVVGYDLTKLICGSEGTLAVITQIVIKLLPLPEAKQTMLELPFENAAQTQMRRENLAGAKGRFRGHDPYGG